MQANTEPKSATRPDIVRDLHIDAPIEDVWAAITEGDEIQRWFAPHATSTPGPGGIIKLGWADDMTWDMPIAEWEPPRRLVIRDTGDAGTESLAEVEPAGTALRIEYTLESKDGGTALHLVHSGFGPGPDWAEIYDGTCTGWTYELQALKHYLEHHKGQLRRLVRATAPIAVKKDEAWRRLFRSDAIGFAGDPDALRVGAPFEASTVTGERLTGRVVMKSETAVGVAIDQYNGALLRVMVERWCGEGNRMEAMVWLSTHDVDLATVEAFEKQWNRVLSNLFAA